MWESHNVNVINKVNSNVTMNIVGNRNNADVIADKLCEKLGNHEYRAFYCKVAYKLTEAQIWSCLEIAQKGKNPARYFTWLVKRKMQN